MNENLDLHIEKAKAAYSIFNKLNVSYPFIQPFGIPYFQSDIKSKFKYYLKILFEKHENIKPVIFNTEE